jgi:hypothetical protein
MIHQYLRVHSGSGEVAASSVVVPTEKQKVMLLYQGQEMQVEWGWVARRWNRNSVTTN